MIGHPLAAPPEPRRVLVRFRDDVDDAEAEGILRPHRGRRVGWHRETRRHDVEVPPGQARRIARELAQHARVEWAEADEAVAPALVLNDPQIGSQWHLAKIECPAAWDMQPGAPGVTIAILDSGCYPPHPDLAPAYVPGWNVVDGNANTADVHGHGTLVAGCAAAIGNNGIGVAGVAYAARIMPIRVSDPSGYAYYSTLSDGLFWAADHGARVMNMSFSGVAVASSITAAAQYCRSKGAVVVGAAGNSGGVENVPENPYVLSVSATDSYDTLAGFSSRGPYVDVAAPGVWILTTDWYGGYGAPNGTSFSSPITCGVVALMMAANPALSPAEIETLLEQSADDLGAGGWDENFGWGRINARRAVEAARSSLPVPDPGIPLVFIEFPPTGAVITSIIQVLVQASDDVGVSRVQLWLDGQPWQSPRTRTPYAWTFNPEGMMNGPHTITAKAYDAAGNEGVSAPITVIVNNVDTTAPQVAITSPGDGATLAGVVTLAAAATDAKGVARVDFYVDGVKVGTATAAPYTYAWDTEAP